MSNLAIHVLFAHSGGNFSEETIRKAETKPGFKLDDGRLPSSNPLMEISKIIILTFFYL